MQHGPTIRATCNLPTTSVSLVNYSWSYFWAEKGSQRQPFWYMCDVGPNCFVYTWIGLPYCEKNYDNTLSRFHTIPERNGQTDGQTESDRQTDRQICYINIARVSVLTHVPVKSLRLLSIHPGWIDNRRRLSSIHPCVFISEISNIICKQNNRICNAFMLNEAPNRRGSTTETRLTKLFKWG